jgi:hypothetical protein
LSDCKPACACCGLDTTGYSIEAMQFDFQEGISCCDMLAEIDPHLTEHGIGPRSC